MLPISASDILRKSAPRDTIGMSFAHVNRFEQLRDVSPAPSFRSRAESVISQKRKTFEEAEEEEVSESANRNKVSRMDEGEELDYVFIESKLTKVTTLIGKITTEVQKQDMEVTESHRSFLADLVEALKVTNEAQNDMLNLLKSRKGIRATEGGGGRAGEFSYSAVAGGGRGNGPKGPYDARRMPASGFFQATADPRGRLGGAKVSQPPQETEEEKLQRKFTEAIREAERSTLCFNLDMGNVPIMNKTTISEKASLALTKMAAGKDKRKGNIPSSDAVAAIDDVTSLVTKMDFFW
jgi:hypothetical protein